MKMKVRKLECVVAIRIGSVQSCGLAPLPWPLRSPLADGTLVRQPRPHIVFLFAVCVSYSR
jgi:hypothetical protein